MNTHTLDPAARSLFDVLRPLSRWSKRSWGREPVFHWVARCGALRTDNFQLVDGTISIHSFANPGAGGLRAQITASPRSTDPWEAHSQLARLADHCLRLGAFSVPVGAGTLETELPAGRCELVLTNDWGRELATVTLQTAPRPDADEFLSAPSRLQSGEPLVLMGQAFAAWRDNLTVSIDGEPVEPRVIDPRGCVITLDPDRVGPVRIEVRSGERCAAVTTRVVRLHLECSQATLVPGQAAWLTVWAEGAGAASRVALCNLAPAVVELGSGSLSGLEIADGMSTRLRLRALRSGGFALTAHVESHADDSCGAALGVHAEVLAGRVEDQPH
jgi:hypothetical protein